jgi:hypothetical protein
VRRSQGQAGSFHDPALIAVLIADRRRAVRTARFFYGRGAVRGEAISRATVIRSSFQRGRDSI